MSRREIKNIIIMLLNDFHLPPLVKVFFGIFLLLTTSLAQAVQLKGG